MCYNCGCGDPHDKMGHEENITEEDIQAAAKVMEMDVNAAKRNMMELLEKTTKKDK